MLPAHIKIMFDLVLNS